MAKFEYSIRSKDETGQGVKSAQTNLGNLEGTLKNINKVANLLNRRGRGRDNLRVLTGPRRQRIRQRQ